MLIIRNFKCISLSFMQTHILLSNRYNKVNQAFEILDKSNEALPNSPKPTSFLLKTYMYNKFNSVPSQIWSTLLGLQQYLYLPKDNVYLPNLQSLHPSPSLSPSYLHIYSQIQKWKKKFRKTGLPANYSRTNIYMYCIITVRRTLPTVSQVKSWTKESEKCQKNSIYKHPRK